MQIILISSRTLGASELLLLLSLFSHLFFSLLFVFLLLLLFLKSLFSPPLPLYLLLFSIIRLSSLLPSGLVVGFVSRGSFMAVKSTWPNPRWMPDPEEGDASLPHFLSLNFSVRTPPSSPSLGTKRTLLLTTAVSHSTH